MAGYTRQDGGNISNGNIIDATDLNAEFDKLQTAFASSGGHTHDGTSDGGARIEVVGPNGEVTVSASSVTPKVSTDVDVGTASLKFNNANFKGTVSAPTFTATSGATIPSLTVGSSTAVTSVDEDLSSVSANHDTLASAKAIKTYVDSQVTAQDLDITDGTTTGSIDLDSQSLTFTGSTGITASVSNQTVTISTDDSAIAHDSLSGFVSAEHVDHSGVTITAGNGLTGGGTIEATRTLTVDPHTGIAVTADGVALSHLGLQDLADPDADRVAFWDDSEGAFKWLEMGSNLAISGTTLNATDTDTTYSAGTGLTLSGTTFNANVDATTQTTAAETVTSTASRTYAVQVDSSDNLVVNVPWVDTDTDTDTTYTAGTGLTLDGTTFNANVDATTQTVAAETVSATASRTYAVQTDNSDNLVVNVPWTSPSTLTSSGVVNITPTTDENSSDNQPTVIIKSALTPDSNSRRVRLQLRNTDTTGLGLQECGRLIFSGNNTGTGFGDGDPVDFVQLIGGSTVATTGSEESEFEIFHRKDGSAFGAFKVFSQNNNHYMRLTSPGTMDFLSERDSNDPRFNFTTKFVTGTSRPIDINLVNRDSSPTSGDTIGTIKFRGEPSSNVFVDYASITADIHDVTSGAEDGSLQFNVLSGGSQRTILDAEGSGDINIRQTANQKKVKIYDATDTHNISFDVTSNFGNILASGYLRITSSSGNALQIHSGGDTIISPDGGNIDLKKAYIGGHENGRIDLNTANQIKFRTWNGSSYVLNTTMSGANLTVAGALSKGSGSFKIDHPLPAKTDTHHLVHSFIEGPQADLIYRGRVELVDGTATVNIDTAAGMTEGTFVVLCGDVQCFTSNESGWTAVKGSVSGNTLTITAQDNTCADTISWMVVGERKDQHMIDTDWTDDEGHVIVEPAKQ
jgi:hypothetical protein